MKGGSGQNGLYYWRYRVFCIPVSRTAARQVNSSPGGLTASGVLLRPAHCGGASFLSPCGVSGGFVRGFILWYALSCVCAFLRSCVLCGRVAVISSPFPCRAASVAALCALLLPVGASYTPDIFAACGAAVGLALQAHPRRGDGPRHPGSRGHGGGRLVPLADFAQPGGGQFLRRFG